VSRLLAVLTLGSLFLVALQLDVFSGLRFFGVVVMLVWLWPFCLAVVGLGAPALVWGGVVGLLFDAGATTPFGLTVVVNLVIAFGVSRLANEGVGDLDSSAWWMTPLMAAVVGCGAPLLAAVLATATLNTALWHGSLLATMLVNAVAFAVLARPVARLVQRFVGVGRR
jgi:cell shape-determining protein MreD